jgi:hypothetical protein
MHDEHIHPDPSLTKPLMSSAMPSQSRVARYRISSSLTTPGLSRVAKTRSTQVFSTEPLGVRFTCVPGTRQSRPGILIEKVTRCSCCKSRGQRSDRYVILELPLFPGYLFCRCAEPRISSASSRRLRLKELKPYSCPSFHEVGFSIRKRLCLTSRPREIR